MVILALYSHPPRMSRFEHFLTVYVHKSGWRAQKGAQKRPQVHCLHGAVFEHPWEPSGQIYVRIRLGSAQKGSF